MKIDRREFLTLTGAGLGLMACGGGGAQSQPSANAGPPAPAKPKPRAFLILGGTHFLGPALVEAARERGHSITLFNRGKSNPGMFPDLEELHGDRDGHLEALAGRKWDAVIDTSGFVPRLVTDSAKLLAPNVGQYLFISTISVFSDNSIVGMDESAPVGKLKPEEEGTEKVTPTSYGPLKALCEQAAEAAMPGRTTVVRPGLIVGPRDNSDRFTYWPVRIDRGGEVLAPGDGTDPVQFIDARDLARFCVKCCEDGTMGTFNATGPTHEMTMSAMLDGIKRGVGSNATFVWAPDAFLDKNEVSAWMNMPVWVPAKSKDDAGFARINVSKAIGKGLTFRSVDDTARDTLAWWKTLPEDKRQKPMGAGITAARETELLEKLKAWKKT